MISTLPQPDSPTSTARQTPLLPTFSPIHHHQPPLNRPPSLKLAVVDPSFSLEESFQKSSSPKKRHSTLRAGSRLPPRILKSNSAAGTTALSPIKTLVKTKTFKPTSPTKLWTVKASTDPQPLFSPSKATTRNSKALAATSLEMGIQGKVNGSFSGESSSVDARLPPLPKEWNLDSFEYGGSSPF